MKKIDLYTDGACSGNPGPGGWGAVLIYNGIKLIRETRAQQLIKGILVLIVCYIIAVLFNLQTIRFILKICFQWGFLALIILFQPELRRILEKVGRTKISEFNFFNTTM